MVESLNYGIRAMDDEQFNAEHAPGRLILPVVIAFMAALCVLGGLWLISMRQIDDAAAEREEIAARQLLATMIDRPPEEIVGALNASGLGRARLGVGKANMDGLLLPIPRSDGTRVGQIWFEPFRPALYNYQVNSPYKIATVVGMGVVLALVLGRLVMKLHNLDARRAEAHRMAMSDPVSGLANQRQFAEWLFGATAKHGSGPAPLALYFLKVDGLGSISDTFGRDVGEAVVGSIADRLTDFVPKGDLVARLSADEFAIIGHKAMDAAAVLDFGQALVKVLTTPYDAGDTLARAGVSIGVALLRSGEMVAQIDLCRAADLALRAAKSAGGNRTIIFTQDLLDPNHAPGRDRARPAA